MYAEIFHKFAQAVQNHKHAATEEAFTELRTAVKATEAKDFAEKFENRTFALFEIMELWASNGLFIKIDDQKMASCQEDIAKKVISKVTFGGCFQMNVLGEDYCFDCPHTKMQLAIKYWGSNAVR